MSLRSRVRRIKRVPFADALRLVAPEVSVSPPEKICCPFPDHEDRTPSCSIREEGWHCFGCGRGGDVLSFAREYFGVSFPRAVEIVEGALGLREDGQADLALLKAAAEREEREPDLLVLWREALRRIEADFSSRVVPYLRCADPLVSELATSQVGHVFEGIDEERWRAPRTRRGLRERAGTLLRWAREHAAGVERHVEGCVGKDRLDVLLQGSGAKWFRASGKSS